MQQDESYDRVREALVRATETMRGQKEQIAELNQTLGLERGYAHEQIAALKATWKCFHCGFETTSRKEAEAHFGDGEGEPSMCIFWLAMPDHERVHAYQELSVELENERADIQRQAKEIKRYREALEKIEQRANERHSGERERDVVYAMYYLATNALKTKTEV